MHVLVVEDDRDLGAFLAKGLENEGHSAEWLEDGEAALQYVGEQHPDLIVLDLGLSGQDGLELLTELHLQGSDAALLVLTGSNDLRARVECLDMGADDCLLKPFSFLEFTARCRALLRRRAQLSDPVLRHADIELHRVNHQVKCGGREVTLTTKEFALLEYLMLRRGESVLRTELLANVYEEQGCDPQTVRAADRCGYWFGADAELVLSRCGIHGINSRAKVLARHRKAGRA
jgi:DNA-binding response OmpR family regulator